MKLVVWKYQDISFVLLVANSVYDILVIWFAIFDIIYNILSCTNGMRRQDYATHMGSMKMAYKYYSIASD